MLNIIIQYLKKARAAIRRVGDVFQVRIPHSFTSLRAVTTYRCRRPGCDGVTLSRASVERAFLPAVERIATLNTFDLRFRKRPSADGRSFPFLPPPLRCRRRRSVKSQRRRRFCSLLRRHPPQPSHHQTRSDRTLRLTLWLALTLRRPLVTLWLVVCRVQEAQWRNTPRLLRG